MSEVETLIALIKRYEMTGEPDLEEEIRRLKLICVQSLKLQEIVKERIEEISPANTASDEYDEFTILQSLVEESEK